MPGKSVQGWRANVHTRHAAHEPSYMTG